MTFDPHALFPIDVMPAEHKIKISPLDDVLLTNLWGHYNSPLIGTFWCNNHLMLRGEQSPLFAAPPALVRQNLDLKQAAKTWSRISTSLSTRRPAVKFYINQYTLHFKILAKVCDDVGNYAFVTFGYLSYLRRAHSELELLLPQGAGSTDYIALVKGGELHGMLMPCMLPSDHRYRLLGPMPLRAS